MAVYNNIAKSGAGDSVTWASITTTWGTETRTWEGLSPTTYVNVSKNTAVYSNVSKN